jgi:hypothetical protein
MAITGNMGLERVRGSGRQEQGSSSPTPRNGTALLETEVVSTPARTHTHTFPSPGRGFSNANAQHLGRHPGQASTPRPTHETSTWPIRWCQRAMVPTSQSRLL